MRLERRESGGNLEKSWKNTTASVTETWLQKMVKTWETIHKWPNYSWVNYVDSKIDRECWCFIWRISLWFWVQWVGKNACNCFFPQSKTFDHDTTWRVDIFCCRQKSTNQFVMGKPLSKATHHLLFIFASQEAGQTNRPVASWPVDHFCDPWPSRKVPRFVVLMSIWHVEAEWNSSKKKCGSSCLA